jgi:hypothetical protein
VPQTFLKSVLQVPGSELVPWWLIHIYPHSAAQGPRWGGGLLVVAKTAASGGLGRLWKVAGTATSKR